MNRVNGRVGGHDVDRNGEHRQPIGETVCAAQVHADTRTCVGIAGRGKLQPGLTRSVGSGQRPVGTAYSGAQVGECGRTAWPTDAATLDAEQLRLAALKPDPWPLPSRPFVVAGCFVAFVRGQQGPGHAGDQMWVGAALVRCPGLELVDSVVVSARAGAAYDPGRLALREGAALAAALAALPLRPDVLMLDATGRDHPRGAGLALHLGAVLDLPSVGVTHRPLRAWGSEPGAALGDSTPLLLDSASTGASAGSHGLRVVGAWLRTKAGVRPVAVHPGWRVDAETAVRVVLAAVRASRTPEPLRQARQVARTARARAETLRGDPG